MKRSLACFASAALLLCAFANRGMAQTSTKSETSTTRGNEYYVDCSSSGKSGDGHSPLTAWHGLDVVNGHVFAAGDVIYLRRGTECHGLLWPKGSGSAAGAIRLSAYGTGARPKVIASQGDEEAFKLFNQEFWEVDSIDFAGGKIFGVFVSGDTGILHHIHLSNLVVHDVQGGDVKHKESGLVVISPGKAQQHFEDVLVEGVTAYRTNQWSGILVGGGNFGEVAEGDWSTHVVVRNSVVHDVFGDGIILFRVKDGLIDTSAAWYMGMQPTQTIGTPNAIWTWMCEDCVVRKCEAFLTDSPGFDGGAYDIDYGNTRNSVIDSYGHDTQGYCVAVFGAGYVTHDSVVEGNLCVNNGRSPRMAQYQGAIFLYTWNGGVIENLRVEKNTVYWQPPGNFPAVLNRADIQGSERTFRENQIYSGSAKIVESNKEISLRDNRYTTCGTNGVDWIFDNHAYHRLDEFRAGSSQEEGSSWKHEKDASVCFGGERLGSRRGTWAINSEIPASIDAHGLLDAGSTGQLMVLKNLYRQYRASGLRVEVTLGLKQASSGEFAQNLIGDLGMSDVKISEAPELTRSKTRLIAPDGTVVKEWEEFVGPVEIGLQVRKALGEPLYSLMESEDGAGVQ